MPYIPQEDRDALDLFCKPQTPGELNYLITQECRKFLHVVGESYATLNAIIGALECAKLEFVRRVINPYEDGAIERNGDLF